MHMLGFVSREDAKEREEREGSEMADIEELARLTIDCGLRIHKDLGPGLLESVYEAVLASSLTRLGIKADRQVPIGIEYDGLTFADGFRADLLVDDCLIVEVKSVDRLMPVHGRQVLTYLRLTDQPLGVLLNFGGATFREGIRRIVNNHTEVASSRLRVNQPELIQATDLNE